MMLKEWKIKWHVLRIKNTLMHGWERQNNYTWMRWINAKKMAAIWTSYSKVSKTLEHLGFMEFEKGTQECKKAYDCSSWSKTSPWIIVSFGSKLLRGAENKKLTGKLVSSTRVWMVLRECLITRKDWFKAFITLVENEIGVKIKFLKLDNVNTLAKWDC